MCRKELGANEEVQEAAGRGGMHWADVQEGWVCNLENEELISCITRVRLFNRAKAEAQRGV